MKTMLCLEDTYFSMAEKITSGQNALVICDRGTMDASAFISAEEWSALLDKLNLEESHICENRYDQVVHMVSLCNCVLIYFVARFYRLVGKHYSLQFLPATTSSLSRTLEGLFELTRRPSRALDSPRPLPLVADLDFAFVEAKRTFLHLSLIV